MKKSFITHRAKKFLSICAVTGLLAFTACGNSNEGSSEDVEYGMGANTGDPGGLSEQASEYERTSSSLQAQRNYDVNTLGTAADNRSKMETAGVNLNDAEFQRLWEELGNVNEQLYNSYGQYPGLSVRYTDDYKTADYNYGYYGLYYDNVERGEGQTQYSALEQQRNELRNKLRGRKDPQTGAYIAAEMDAVPKQGYNAFYEKLGSELKNAQTAAKPVNGQVFVKLIVDETGKVTYAEAVETVLGNVEPNTISGRKSGNAGLEGMSGVDETNEDLQEKYDSNNSGTKEQQQKQIAQLEEQVEAAVKATSGMWEPAQMNGQPVASIVQLPVPVN